MAEGGVARIEYFQHVPFLIVRASSTNFPEQRSAQGGGAAQDAETCGGSRQATVASGASCSQEQRSWVGAEPGRRAAARRPRKLQRSAQLDTGERRQSMGADGGRPARRAPRSPLGDSHRQGREGCGRSRAAQGREAARSPSAPLDWIRPHHWISRWAGNPAG